MRTGCRRRSPRWVPTARTSSRVRSGRWRRCCRHRAARSRSERGAGMTDTHAAGEAVAQGTAEHGVVSTFDHLVIAVPDLAAGVREFEELTGVRTTPGGSHPGRGTANHIVSLTPRGWTGQ